MWVMCRGAWSGVETRRIVRVEIHVIDHVLDDGHAKIVLRRPEPWTLLCRGCCCNVVIVIIIMETTVINIMVVIMVAVNVIIVAIDRGMARRLVERLCVFMQAGRHGTTTNIMMTGRRLCWRRRDVIVVVVIHVGERAMRR